MNTASPHPGDSSPARDRRSLRADCGNCFALCCTAFGFARSTDFAVDKAAGTPCLNLAADFSCTIHDRLRPRGFRGCTVFDCFGAGQHVSQQLFAGRNWREQPEAKEEMFAAFAVSRQLHEALWHLAEAERRTLDPDLAAQAGRLRAAIDGALAGEVQDLLAMDVADLHDRVRAALLEVSAEVRAYHSASGDGRLESSLCPGAQLMGVKLRARQLCGADLRGAYLIAADLRGSDLAGADLLGADLRDARLDGADLSRALYLTQPQLNAAMGDRETRLPPDLTMPANWEAATV
ncbi:pentapeptide repeat protein [Microterricola gilva]|uniref:Pentapeptide repeat protein n=1 Tax=Microterricola gilva TaxID=393267 RepID=A0A4Q8AM08_9MICO|nr:pentapeptide repeat-containing protein [Microterricola gilva]RZU65594.1 pentapeptide repeat protein [Microterricola gilva]